MTPNRGRVGRCRSLTLNGRTTAQTSCWRFISLLKSAQRRGTVGSAGSARPLFFGGGFGTVGSRRWLVEVEEAGTVEAATVSVCGV
jgi:hypothetical protein